LYSSYTKASFGLRAYSFEARSKGYYYVKVQGVNSVSKSYKLGVGDHTYALAHCLIKFGSVTMSNKIDFVRRFDLSENTNIPDEALVYEVLLNNVRSSRASGATLDNISQDSEISLRSPLFHVSNIGSKGLQLKSKWKLTIGYKKDSTINPALNVLFVYPVTSEFLPSDEIIINAF